MHAACGCTVNDYFLQLVARGIVHVVHIASAGYINGLRQVKEVVEYFVDVLVVFQGQAAVCVVGIIRTRVLTEPVGGM